MKTPVLLPIVTFFAFLSIPTLMLAKDISLETKELVLKTSEQNWNFECPTDNTYVSQAREVIHKILIEGLSKLFTINPHIKSHIVYAMNGSSLLFTCESKESKVSIRDAGIGLEVGAEYSFEVSLDNGNKLYYSMPPRIRVPSLFRVIPHWNNEDDRPITNIHSLSHEKLVESEMIFHEFLHHVRLDNQHPEDHNQSVNRSKDAVYSCSNYAYDTQFYSDIMPWSKIKFRSFKVDDCAKCALVRPLSKLWADEDLNELRTFRLYPNTSILSSDSLRREAKRICESLVSKEVISYEK